MSLQNSNYKTRTLCIAVLFRAFFRHNNNRVIATMHKSLLIQVYNSTWIVEIMDAITIYVVLQRNVMYVMYVLHFALGASSAVTTFLRRNGFITA